MLSREFLEDTYEKAWGQPCDRPFQIDVADALVRDGKAVLRAPTGSGKTRAALLAALAAWRCGEPLVDRVLYAVPIRSLATSLADAARQAIEAMRLPLRVTVQMGGQEEDPLYERGHIVFTTVDQLLSRFLSLPYSMGAARANMCPGALVGSLIVLDEIHLYDRQRALSTALVMLGRYLSEIGRFLVMSATLTEAAVSALAHSLDCGSLCVSPGEARGWAGFAGISRRVEVADSALSSEDLLASLATAGWPRRVLVVANTVDRAQRLHQGLVGRQHPYAVKLLHSRYLASDRKAIEEPALALFGQARASAAADPVLLVATQVIEVGLDLSCDRMHAELAPASSLVQRFGRCARWLGEAGVIVVHPLETDGAGRRRYGPYRGQEETVDRTWECLRARAGQPMDAFAANDLVETVHGGDDEREFAGFDLSSVERQQVTAAIDAGEVAMRRALIRDVDGVSVLVLDDVVDCPDPRRVAEWVSVPRPALHGLVERFRGSSVMTFDFDAEGPSGWPGAWRSQPLSAELVRSATLLVLPSSLAAYSVALGLQLGVRGLVTPVLERSESRRPRFGYRREPYLDHVARVVQAGRLLEEAEYTSPDELQERRPGMAVGLAMLDKQFDTSGMSALLCRLACALHDVGKLSRPWQEWADVWERTVNLDHHPEPLAHTTFDPDCHGFLEKRFQQEGPRRPPHAVASALACATVVQDLVDGLLARVDDQRRTNVADAVLTAVGRHHTPRARQGEPFWPTAGTDEIVRRSLELAAFPMAGARPIHLPTVSQHREMNRFEDEVVVRLGRSSDRGGMRAAREALTLYWVIVRYLRIADGHSQALARVEEA